MVSAFPSRAAVLLSALSRCRPSRSQAFTDALTRLTRSGAGVFSPQGGAAPRLPERLRGVTPRSKDPGLLRLLIERIAGKMGVLEREERPAEEKWEKAAAMAELEELRESSGQREWEERREREKAEHERQWAEYIGGLNERAADADASEQAAQDEWQQDTLDGAQGAGGARPGVRVACGRRGRDHCPGASRRVHAGVVCVRSSGGDPVFVLAPGAACLGAGRAAAATGSGRAGPDTLTQPPSRISHTPLKKPFLPGSG